MGCIGSESDGAHVGMPCMAYSAGWVGWVANSREQFLEPLI